MKPKAFYLDHIIENRGSPFLRKFSADIGDLVLNGYGVSYIFQKTNNRYYTVCFEDNELQVEIYGDNEYEVIPESAMSSKESREYFLIYSKFKKEATEQTNFAISTVPGIYFSDN